jgi:polyisoprenoid-binding protein YceI
MRVVVGEGEVVGESTKRASGVSVACVAQAAGTVKRYCAYFPNHTITRRHMSAPQNVVADLTAFAERGQNAATDVFQWWTTTVQAVGDAAGTQASSFRRLVRGMFDLADQIVVIERELATFLTVNAQVSAAALDTFRKLTDSATAAMEDMVRATAWRN